METRESAGQLTGSGQQPTCAQPRENFSRGWHHFGRTVSKHGGMRRKKPHQQKQRPRRRRVEINVQQLDQIVDKACAEPLSTDEAELLKSSIHAMAERLQPRFRTTEQAKKLLDDDGEVDGNKGAEAAKEPGAPSTPTEQKRRPGHGRNGVADYPGATFVTVSHSELTPKCICPGCGKGRLYEQKTPRTLLRITGMPPIQATVYNMQNLRCNLCLEQYPAPAPPGVGEEKYDSSVASMLALLKYGKGMTFYRIEALQKNLGVPLPAATQFELLDASAKKIEPLQDELKRQAAQAEVQWTDDTKARILEDVDRPEEQGEDRVGLQTTGTVSRSGDHLIALFTTGPNHAGENMRDLLQQRAKDLPPPVLMSDGLNHNVPKVPPALTQLLANCLVHGRRQFVDIIDSFPEECRHVIEQIGLVYRHDAQAEDQGLDAQARLQLHQKESGPVMEALKTWMELQLMGTTEPNSGLGKAIRYFLKRWDRLTLFLRHPGAPLDNNVVERALKKAVLNRKNALFFKTQHGAEVADLYMSIIHTCELNDVNSFHYLTELQRHAAELRDNPGAWLPWNYHLQLVPAPDLTDTG